MSESEFVFSENATATTVTTTATKSETSGKKRGRKSKKEIEDHALKLAESKLTENNLVESKGGMAEEDAESEENNNVTPDKPEQSIKVVPKKRGRKPKGGKIVQVLSSVNPHKEVKPNVILHLKCSLKELNQQSFVCTGLEGFSFSEPMAFNSPNSIPAFGSTKPLKHEEDKPLHAPIKLMEEDETDTDNDDTAGGDIRDIWKKLKALEHNLHINSVDNKKSACFWDTCEFDNPPVYIPKYVVNGSYHVYGCFCSPECAVAHLMEENIDSSVKFERYCLLNQVYGKVCNYQKNIKPAPNPYYMLEKFCGNLSIQEYRALLRNDRLFLVVDKPLTRIMPELHEDNDDFIINNKIIPSNSCYQVKKKMQKKTKTNIMHERFGASASQC